MADEGPSPSPRRTLAGLLAIVALVLVVVFIMDKLHESAKLQDCLASGRTNCMPIDATKPR
jgi:hypothetical protein